MDGSAQYRALDDFNKAIYPIWKSIEKNDSENEKAMTAGQVNETAVMLECSTIHKQDLAIHASGHKPNRTSQAQAAMGDLRRRSVRAGGA